MSRVVVDEEREIEIVLMRKKADIDVDSPSI